MTIGSGNDQWEASLDCDGGSGGCEDPRAGFGVTQEQAEAAVIAAARKSAWREGDGRWLCPLCYLRGLSFGGPFPPQKTHPPPPGGPAHPPAPHHTAKYSYKTP